MIENSENIWLLDYDLTLYGEEERFVLDSLDKRIAQFVQKTVGGDFLNATKIRKDYLKKYGTTLAGLMALESVNPDDFFDYIHNPDFLIYPKESREKFVLLNKLKGPKYVFTNGRADWCKAGISSMKLENAISEIFDLKQMNWVGKPHSSAYSKIENWLKERNVLPKNQNKIILVEDSLRNLEPAYKRGWTTILVNPSENAPSWVDYHIPHLLNLTDVVLKDRFRV